MAEARDPGSIIESIFSAWVSRQEKGEGESIESLIEAHPEHRQMLRGLYADWKEIQGLEHQASRRESSLADRLRERFGSGVDPEVSLDGDATDERARSDSGSESKLYDDLRQRGPSSGRYRLDGELAQGGMGAILRVYDKDLRRNLAMKVMLEEKEGRLSRFLEEAQVTGQLDHPGIVPVHELGIDARGKVFFTMKLVKGKDLREIFEMVENGTDGWSVTRAVDVLKRVCEAMAFAHEKNVIHRDLKPANIMVGRHGEVYVMDWGLAKVLGQKETKDVRIAPASQSVVNTERRKVGSETPDSPLLTMDGDAIGTPSYMPIEQAEGNLDALGPRTDIYAIGAMLYHLLAGHAPYVEADENVAGRIILKRVLTGPPEPIRSLAKHAPVELIAICEKAMARKAAQRYASMTELSDDLRAYLERRVVKAHKTGVVAETRMWVVRNRALAASIVIGFLALGAFGWSQRIAAERAEKLAEGDRQRAAALDRVLQLADVKELRDLQARGKALLDDRVAVYRSYRGYDGLITSMKQWITDAETLAQRLPTHDATLATIEARGRRSANGNEIQFDSREDSWWHSAVWELVSGFRSLTLDDPNVICVRAMRERMTEFETTYAHSIGEHRAEWDTCIASIADPAQCPQYNGLKVVPQVGLLPIGRDPQSGLWEFWFVDVTGVKPHRGTDEKLELTDDFGLVFVLLAGGEFWMGAQNENSLAPNYDPYAPGSYIRKVPISAFLISKFEMTVHQWVQGSQDSDWPYGGNGARFPAGMVTWYEAVTVLPRLYLELPTEARWEYACRAGTSSAWSTGSNADSLVGYANLDYFEYDDPEPSPSYVDISRNGAAAVGSFLPNGFGLHDMHGNIFEWCINSYPPEPSEWELVDVTPKEHAIGRPGNRSYRSGYDWSNTNHPNRSAARDGFDAGRRLSDLGVRPCRDLMPD